MNIQSFRGYIPQRPVQSRDRENLATNRTMSKDVSFERGLFIFYKDDAVDCITKYAIANNLTKKETSNLSRRVLKAAKNIKEFVRKTNSPDTYLLFENPIDKELKIKIGCGDFNYNRKYYDKIHFPPIGDHSDRQLTKHLNMLDNVEGWIGDIASAKQSKNEATEPKIKAAIKAVFENFQE